MEDRAPYTPAGGPRNLAAPLAAWLRTQGWTCTEHTVPGVWQVNAHWYGPHEERFELRYLWERVAQRATCQLQVLGYGRLPEHLFSAQHVRRLREARALVSNCVRYANARRLALAPS